MTTVLVTGDTHAPGRPVVQRSTAAGHEVCVGTRTQISTNSPRFGFVPMVYEPSLQPARSVTLADFDSGPFENFPASHGLTADGAVKLLPIPGHTPGHSCVVVHLGDHGLLIAGDCLYTLRHLATATSRPSAPRSESSSTLRPSVGSMSSEQVCPS